MNTPILIAARNEADHLGRTLDALPANVEPIVITNDCTDATADIVSSFQERGVRLLESAVHGKMPALQMGMRFLGDRALDPFIILDADTRPFAPRLWAGALLLGRKALPDAQPAVVMGTSIYVGTNLLSGAHKTLAHARRNIRTRRNNDEGGFCGRNMLVHPVNYKALDRLLELPHIWPGEDAATKDELVEEGGSSLKLVNPMAAVYTSADRYPSLRERLTKGREQARATIRDSYLDDAASGSITYEEWKAQKALQEAA